MSDFGSVTTILTHDGFDGVIRNPVPEDVIVAGVYVKEDRVDFIVGCLNDQQLKIFLDEKVPRTHNAGNKKRAHSFFPRNGLQPKAFIEAAAQYLAGNVRKLDYIVIACFGSFISLKYTPFGPAQENVYGRLNDVPQYMGWQRISIYEPFRRAFSERGLSPEIRVCTDVDAAAFGEYWADPNVRGTHLDFDRSCVAFLKFSRTINVGVCSNGRALHGQLHPVAGALIPRRYECLREGEVFRDEFIGCCDYHDDCLEGLIGQLALEKRSGVSFGSIRRDDFLLWEIVAYYISSLCVSVAALVAPTRIVLGGRIVGDDTEREAARTLLLKVRGHFYKHVKSEVLGKKIFSPDYSELRDEGKFICLPEKLKVTDSGIEERTPRPGRHGALRMAAKLALDAREERR